MCRRASAGLQPIRAESEHGDPRSWSLAAPLWGSSESPASGGVVLTWSGQPPRGVRGGWGSGWGFGGDGSPPLFVRIGARVRMRVRASARENRLNLLCLLGLRGMGIGNSTAVLLYRSFAVKTVPHIVHNPHRVVSSNIR